MARRIIGVDVGGTFTDVVAVEDGRILTTKVPTNPDRSDESVLEGAAVLDVGSAAVFNLASTAGLNAVITRRLPKVAFLTTEGHRDMLDRGSLVRPLEALTDPSWRRNFGDAGRPLVPRYLRRGIRERVTATGEILIPLDEDDARQHLRVLRTCKVEGVAVCLLHSYANDIHEKRVRDLVREELGKIPCSISSEVSPTVKEFRRGTTTLIDVLMKLLYGDYSRRLSSGLKAAGFHGQLNYADCRAALLPEDYAMERPYQLVMGGPAGGAVAAAHFGSAIGDEKLVCADVGGTSCDISLVINGKPWSSGVYELEHDLVVNTPSVNVVTLGAGGGSIIRITQEGDIATGPDSAGAFPGPACYAQGGNCPTLTDAALLAGIIAPERFLGGRKPLHAELALQAFQNLASKHSFPQRVRFGWDVAIHNIAEGIVDIAIRRGIDLREFSLIAFGAAGGMLLPSLLDHLPVRRVIVPPHPGLFSALGLASADRVYSDHRGAYVVLTDDACDHINAVFEAMESNMRGRISSETGQASFSRSFDAQLLGQSWDNPFIPAPNGRIDRNAINGMIKSFHDAYEELNGNRFDAIPVQAVTFRVQAVVPSEKVRYPSLRPRRIPLQSRDIRIKYLYGEDVPARAMERRAIGPDDLVEGPAVILEDLSTTFVPMGRCARAGALGELVIA